MLHCGWDVQARWHVVYDLETMSVIGVWDDDFLRAMWESHKEEYREMGIDSRSALAIKLAGEPFHHLPKPK